MAEKTEDVCLQDGKETSQDLRTNPGSGPRVRIGVALLAFGFLEVPPSVRAVKEIVPNKLIPKLKPHLPLG